MPNLYYTEIFTGGFPVALSTTSDYALFIYQLLYYMEVTTGRSVGNLVTTPEYTSTTPIVQTSPWVYDLLRVGYNPQDVTNYGPTTGYETSNGKIVQAFPEGQSPTEALDETDINTIVAGYLSYKNTRLSNDTNDVTM
jgi:hypothetical protein